VAFVRLLVGRISLGSAVAAAVAAARDAGDDSAAAQAKTVLKQLRLLLKGDAAATAEVCWLGAGCMQDVQVPYSEYSGATDIGAGIWHARRVLAGS
jgi:hypothetical protein